jgi:alpha-galactosidase
MKKEIILPFPSPAKRYYRHGWQSWSLAAWQDIDEKIAIPKPALLRPMQYDSVYIHEQRPHGSSVGAVEIKNGKIILLGALDLDAHVFLDGNKLIGRYESEGGGWFTAEGSEEDVFAQYATALGERLGKNSATKSPAVWCSWYSFYTHINEENLTQALHNLGDLPFDVFQVDDGWQRAIGDWVPNDKFPGGMDALAAQIRRTGRTPGLWLAPLLVVPNSNIYRQHPDWLLRDKRGKLISAGFNWNKPLYALDTTHPEVLKWLSALMKQVRTWGFDYIKLDFLYAGALPGARHNDIPREQAYRQGLATLREALGDAYLLTCGAPIIPSIGLCDGMRVGPDVASHWDSHRDDVLLSNFAIPGTRNAIRTTVNRLWLKSLVHTDPDVAYFASSKNTMDTTQEKMLQNLARVCEYKATSDKPNWWTTGEQESLRVFLQETPQIERNSRYEFTLDGCAVDFSVAMPIPEARNWFEQLGSTLLGWAGDQPFILRLFSWLGDKENRKKIAS